MVLQPHAILPPASTQLPALGEAVASVGSSALAYAALEGHYVERLLRRVRMAKDVQLLEDLALVAGDDLDGKSEASFELARQRVDAKEENEKKTKHQPHQ